MLYAVLLVSIMISYNLVKSDEENCNKFVCGSVVSICLLTQSCQCELSNCFCCKDCLHCLGNLFMECCSCLDICPKQNLTLKQQAPPSSIGDLRGFPELFDTLTAENEDDEWTTVRFSAQIGLKERFGNSIDLQVSFDKITTNINCTVIYLNSCVSSNKCMQYCESMGANSYRWFSIGCCECVGPYCLQYGLNESRCLACSIDDEETVLDINGLEYEESDFNLDYGEDEIEYNSEL